MGVLAARGYRDLRLPEGSARGDEQVEITLTCLEIAEICGALDDATWMHFDLERLHQWRLFWKKLGEADPEERVRLLRDSGLGRSGQKERTLRRRLNMARHYCALTRRGGVESPEREAALDRPLQERRFGEITRGSFESAKYTNLPGGLEPPPLPGEMIREPQSNVEAVRIIARWYACRDELSALGMLIEARKALRENPNHPVVFHQFPPPYDWFELPNEAKLYT